MNSDLHFKLVRPDKSLDTFVYCFSSLQNLSDFRDGVIIPNGKVDLIFSRTTDQQFRVSLIGLETAPKFLPKQTVSGFFAISFHPLGAEYILRRSIAGFVNSGIELPVNFWDFTITDLDDFDAFCKKASQTIKSLLPGEIDDRKLKLFDLIFSSNGEITVQELSGEICWSQRQINRYFNQQFGISLKAYCKILRFQVSLEHIRGGKLYPQLNFTDQSHFIKEVKQFSGVSPKELFKNQNDRFLQFLATDAG